MDPDKGSARVIYVVNYLPMQLPDAKQTLTFRYSSYISRWLTKKSSNLINVYADSYQAIVNKAKRLGTFKESLWDRSVTEWQVFSEKCRAHRDSMRHLINFARLRGDERVIDVAAGTGHVSKIILETHASVSLTVLDASPRMIGMCRNVLGHDAQYALCKVPPSVNEVAIDLRDSYDFIVIHLSLSAVAATADKLSELALWCKRYLKPSGKVVLSAHNTAVDLQSLFSVDNDPLRQAIRDELKRMELASVYRPVYRKSFTRSDIESAFERAGYVCEAKEQQSFPMQMEDRILLWSAPVVLNEIVEVSQLSEQQIREVLDNTARRLDNQPTPDMTVMYWRFSLLQR
jgi:ubiquinone/menaquinone biosynthesis C-methylase UbiE